MEGTSQIKNIVSLQNLCLPIYRHLNITISRFWRLYIFYADSMLVCFLFSKTNFSTSFISKFNQIVRIYTYWILCLKHFYQRVLKDSENFLGWSHSPISVYQLLGLNRSTLILFSKRNKKTQESEIIQHIKIWQPYILMLYLRIAIAHLRHVV